MDIHVITRHGQGDLSVYERVGQHRALPTGQSRFYVMPRELIGAAVLALVASGCTGAGGGTWWGPVENPASGGPPAAWRCQADG